MIKINLTPMKRLSRDVGRKMKFYTDSAGTTAATVYNSSGTALSQPVKVPANGQLEVQFETWPIYYSDNMSWGTIKPLPGPQEGIEVIYEKTFTLAQINAGTSDIVPARTGYQFVPTKCILQNRTNTAGGGDIGGATLVRAILETTGTVIMSHAVADLNNLAYGLDSGGTVVTNYGTPCTTGKKILIDKTGGSATGCAGGMRAIVKGYWITV